MPSATGPLRATGQPPAGRNGIFGGGLLAQALMAAARTAHSDGRPHSLHASFIRTGDPRSTVDYAAEILRASRRFTTTRVDASQSGVLLASATVSFHSPEVSAEHGGRRSLPSGPDAELGPASGGPTPRPTDPARAPFDLRQCAVTVSEAGRPVLGYWLRAREDLDHRPGLHAAALVWASDFVLTRVADVEHESSPGRRRAASLDLAVWFHRDVDLNAWLFYELSSPVYRDALALSQGTFWDTRGELVATVVQESLLRREYQRQAHLL
jgi:acyl-CoA thioesterase-2